VFATIFSHFGESERKRETKCIFEQYVHTVYRQYNYISPNAASCSVLRNRTCGALLPSALSVGRPRQSHGPRWHWRLGDVRHPGQRPLAISIRCSGGTRVQNRIYQIRTPCGLSGWTFESNTYNANTVSITFNGVAFIAFSRFEIRRCARARLKPDTESMHY
jgi:hypothetical protein